jgi:hypothetical protein
VSGCLQAGDQSSDSQGGHTPRSWASFDSADMHDRMHTLHHAATFDHRPRAAPTDYGATVDGRPMRGVGEFARTRTSQVGAGRAGVGVSATACEACTAALTMLGAGA